MAVTASNGVTLDYDDADDFRSQHCAFLVSDAEFDAILARVVDAQVTYFADSSHRTSGQINHRSGGRGFYFADPDDHNMEVFTKVPLPWTCCASNGTLVRQSDSAGKEGSTRAEPPRLHHRV